MTRLELLNASSQLKGLARKSLKGQVVADLHQNPVTAYLLRRAGQWEDIASSLERIAVRQYQGPVIHINHR